MKTTTFERDADGHLIVAPPRALHVCPSGCDFASIDLAAKDATDGSTITVEPGLYTAAVILRASGVTIQAKPGAHLKGALAEGKAAIVAKGNDTIIDGLECSGVEAPDHNGACVRTEGHNLTLRHIYFHDAEEGLLTGMGTGDIVIEDSRFERLGKNGFAHAIYIGSLDSVTIRRSSFLSSRNEGHEVKSRAARTTIEDSVIASLDGVDSRLLDIPNGGEVSLRNCVLEKGPRAANHNLIGFGLEGIKHEVNSLTLENVEIILDNPAARIFDGPIQPVLRGVRVVGGDNLADASRAVTWFPGRAAARLPAYPKLPSAYSSAGVSGDRSDN
ncbi:right-handed parallel beta-helix repeat-containing protein [Telmatospirillum sp.]|uniref:right-handed parallel beta-helix repeat-containing protein n=1 Tax=Telmatospirillum sp. TaxID=2079197 RepID=UPI002852590C|nr:right-handed parallel beta-helix repeat-containing protein [Telmatospirillum sp.]